MSLPLGCLPRTEGRNPDPEVSSVISTEGRNLAPGVSSVISTEGRNLAPGIKDFSHTFEMTCEVGVCPPQGGLKRVSLPLGCLSIFFTGVTFGNSGVTLAEARVQIDCNMLFLYNNNFTYAGKPNYSSIYTGHFVSSVYFFHALSV